MKMRNVILATLLWCIVSTGVVRGAECPIDCPGDLNGDCRVDWQDFAIFAQHWQEDCTLPPALPVLKVLGPSLTDEQARLLGEKLRIPQEMLAFEDGMAMFADPMNLQKVPTMPLTDPVLTRQLRDDSEVEPGGELAFEVVDLPALRKIVPMPAEAAMEEVFGALRGADVQLGDAMPQTDHTMFEMVDMAGQLLLPAVNLDTRVNFQMYAGGIPIIGPGAQFSASFDPEGMATQLYVANRMVEPSDPVQLMTPADAAVKAFAATAGAFVPEGEMKLVYYAPPMSERNVQVLIPHYDVGGILYGDEGQQAQKLHKLIPATNDPRLVPQVSLQVDAVGNLVQAVAEVSGGTPPYRFEWSSSSADLSEIPEDQSQVEYNAMPRAQAGSETLLVKVTDENGVMVEGTATIPIEIIALAPAGGNVSTTAGDVTVQTGGVRDFGCERGVSDLGAANQSGFVNRFLAEGIVKRFNWGGLSAWEDDFKQPPAGHDSTYVDNADIVFYIGHGCGGYFSFESTVDDKYLTYQNAAGAWGNSDLEWLSLLSCQVLTDTYDSKKWFTRWGPAFDGLHLLTGFQTKAYDWHNFGRRYADYVLGRKFFFTTVTLPIRSAWFQAKKEEQPSDVEAVVMGVVGPSNVLGGYNDYFWGKGPVSPDLRGSNIHGYWRLVYK